MSLFKRAEKKRVYMKIGVAGPSGSGKTMTSLLLARGMHGPRVKVAVIDTENESASLYADRVGFPYDVAAMSPPFLTSKYIKAINEAVAAKYDVVIIDSGTHAWAGTGGILERKDLADLKPGSNKWTNWGPFTKEHNAFMATILHSPIDVLFTVRSKQDYVLEQKGEKSAPKKVGMAPQQREGTEYEFTIFLEIDMNQILTASKDRTGLFRDRMVQLDEAMTLEIGQEIAAWRDSGAALATAPASPPPLPEPPAREPDPVSTTDGMTEPPADYPPPPQHDLGDLPENESPDAGSDEQAPPAQPPPEPAVEDFSQKLEATRPAQEELERLKKDAQAPEKKRKPPKQSAEDQKPPPTARPNGNDPAPPDSIAQLCDYGRSLGLSDHDMNQLMMHRTRKTDWKLTNFEVGFLRTAFAEAGKKGVWK